MSQEFDGLTFDTRPVMTYIAKCPNGCASFKGDSGAVWVSEYMFFFVVYAPC